MNAIQLEEIAEREPVPGYKVRFVHSENMTFAFWSVEAGAALPQHTHPHEQVSTFLEGEFELTIDGERRTFGPGEVVVIPSNVPHSGKAHTACRLLDTFYPVREEYK